MAHLFGCLLSLLGHKALALPGVVSTVVPQKASSLGWILVVLSNVLDVRASLTAHHMFYRWSKVRKRSSNILSTPTKVDATVAFLCTFGCLLAVPDTILSKYLDENLIPYAAVGSAILLLLGVLTNLVASLPSLDFSVPAEVAIVQNLVVAFFTLGSTVRLSTAALMSDGALYTSTYARRLSPTADALILLGASVNYIRVRYLLQNVHHWMVDEGRSDGSNSPRGLLSWFKSSRSNDEMSEYDSDFDDNGLDSDDDGGGQRGGRRSRWSRV